MAKTLTVTFNEHVSLPEAASMADSIAAYGDVLPQASARSFTVEVFRPSKLLGLKSRLVEWERYGFLRWPTVLKDSA